MNEATNEIVLEHAVGKKLSRLNSIELNNSILTYYDMAFTTNMQQNFQNYTCYQSKV